MPRIARLNVPGVLHHVIARFVDRDWFFRCHEERELYLRLFASAMEDTDWRCLSYALMSNHIHLGMVAGEQPLADWSRAVHSPFAIAMNERYDRIGSLFTRGPKDYAIPPAKAGALFAYIHNNPVRAGVVSRASDSDWSSHRAYIGQARAPRWLHVPEGLARADVADGTLFDEFVRAAPGESGEVEARKIRAAARKRGAIEIATPTAGEIPIIPLVARPMARVRVDVPALVRATAVACGIPADEFCSQRRSAGPVMARRIAVHCARAFGITNTDIATVLGISHQAVSMIARTEMDAREQSFYAMILDRLGAWLMAA